ncbi:biotin-dependent carboxyltransferase family protein [Domibacillus sp. A3M-37]|uniref:5-oxoprolinase subunit C family protein n=1 Tax=Domibacillus sp. A3M-37 TaxID=2962037 RepID=UPI0020B65203|nr:biotin-dependent carboxyltransferase family protein [Domibacillus sp. A3M-37]MCP3762187.1 biotin-dependent carboxyltransferase family protein [Domibacillus sp. A3M-37]
MSVHIIRPGLLATIQDLGRYGFQQYGVVVGGAMDSFSLRLANVLVGNEEGEAAIEVTMMGTSLQFKEDTLISITGGNLNPVIDGSPVPSWRPVFVKKDAVLSFAGGKFGCRAYVAVAGGFSIPNVMNSKSTYIRGEIGGFKGRALKEGDVIPLAEENSFSMKAKRALQKKLKHDSFAATDWYVPFESNLNGKVVRVVKGAEFEEFSELAKKQFFEQEFQITPQSDRMGYRLLGPSLQLKQSFELLSEAVANGTIQVPSDGNPIVLLADRQTTGGYPRIGQIAAADLPIIAQMKPGDYVRFKEITLDEAEQLYMEREKEMKQIRTALLLKEWSFE